MGTNSTSHLYPLVFQYLKYIFPQLSYSYTVYWSYSKSYKQIEIPKNSIKERHPKKLTRLMTLLQGYRNTIKKYPSREMRKNKWKNHNFIRQSGVKMNKNHSSMFSTLCIRKSWFWCWKLYRFLPNHSSFIDLPLKFCTCDHMSIHPHTNSCQLLINSPQPDPTIPTPTPS